MKTLEVYMHIPFCRRKCLYCDFASCAGREDQMEPYASALKREIGMRAKEYGPAAVSTLYIGGGTPSLMPPALMADVLECLYDSFAPVADAEITCEANPGTLTVDFLRTLKRHRVNRLSLGVQARQEKHLTSLGRIHRWDEVEGSVRMIREADFVNLNIDLMFGLPSQTLADWRESLEAVLAFSPEHVSCYGLILEEGTPLNELAEKGTLSFPGEGAERAMYGEARRILKKAGLMPYEISNFARKGFACRHNLGYWQGVPYLGFGVAAHSRMDCDPLKGAYARFGNVRSLDTYLKSMDVGEIPVEEYSLIGPREAEFETLMLGLRVLDGVREDDFLIRHGRSMKEAFGEKIDTLIQKGLLKYANGSLRLTRWGMDVQNAVLVDLMD